MHVPPSPRHRNISLGGAKSVILCLLTFLLSLTSAAQTTYHDPKGQYVIQIPAGWQIAPDTDGIQTVVSKGNVKTYFFVMQQNKSNAMTPQETLDATTMEFKGECPTFQARTNGTLTISGAQGLFALSTCSDPKAPTVAEISAALTKNLYTVSFITMSPLADYYPNLPDLDNIRNSLHITGNPGPSSVSNTGKSQAEIELDKACAVGAFTQEDCARQMGILLGQQAKSRPSPSQPVTGTVYQDPTGRFSLQVPTGWTATAEGDKGILGVQLRSGSNWINVLPADPATSASQVVLNDEQKIATQSNSTRKPPFGSLGLIQLFGNGLEVTYDHFSASSAQGDSVDTYVGGVGDISGTGHNFLLVVSSISTSQKDDAGLFISVAQSIHFTAH
jgi:hypothetical protein